MTKHPQTLGPAHRVRRQRPSPRLGHDLGRCRARDACRSPNPRSQCPRRRPIPSGGHPPPGPAPRPVPGGVSYKYRRRARSRPRVGRHSGSDLLLLLPRRSVPGLSTSHRRQEQSKGEAPPCPFPFFLIPLLVLCSFDQGRLLCLRKIDWFVRFIVFFSGLPSPGVLSL